MTTTTWTIPAAAAPAPEFAATGLRIARKIGHFIAVFAGATAETDSAFRGLDLNGNPVWAKPHRT